MDLKILECTVAERTLEPTFLIKLGISYFYNRQAIVGLAGRLVAADGKVLGYLREHSQNTELATFLKPSGYDQIKRISPVEHVYFTSLAFPLSRGALEHIEILRDRHPQKKVSLVISVMIKRMDMPGTIEDAQSPNNPNPLLSINPERFERSLEIENSKWINEFVPHLNIGDFLTVELLIPDDNVPEQWKALYKLLLKNIHQMREAMQHQDWQKVMVCTRRFFENLKFNESQENRRLIKQQIKALFSRQQFSDETFEELYEGIRKLFNYASKFIHDQDQRGNDTTDPLPRREDAYFVYCLAIGLLNLFDKKIRQ